jgi:hypothetical protein
MHNGFRRIPNMTPFRWEHACTVAVKGPYAEPVRGCRRTADSSATSSAEAVALLM